MRIPTSFIIAGLLAAAVATLSFREALRRRLLLAAALMSLAYLAIYGLAVILIVVFMPEGIWGFLGDQVKRLRPRKPAPPRAQELTLDQQFQQVAVKLQGEQ